MTLLYTRYFIVINPITECGRPYGYCAPEDLTSSFISLLCTNVCAYVNDLSVHSVTLSERFSSVRPLFTCPYCRMVVDHAISTFFS